MASNSCGDRGCCRDSTGMVWEQVEGSVTTHEMCLCSGGTGVPLEGWRGVFEHEERIRSMCESWSEESGGKKGFGCESLSGND